jgi:2-polyprenyl-6-methoxyphenol hydroxylase-like FAD-dependent oxidoreductase
MVVRNTNENKEVKVQFDFCVGADGSYSVVRRQLMRVIRYVIVRFMKSINLSQHLWLVWIMNKRTLPMNTWN